MRTLFVGLCATLLALTVWPVAAKDAANPIPSQITDAAAEILKVTPADGHLDVGDIKPANPKAQGSAGPGLQLQLKQALNEQRPGVVVDEQQAGEIDKDSLRQISGAFRHEDDPDKKDFLVETLKLDVRDKTTNKLVDTVIAPPFARTRDIARLEGASISLKPHNDERSDHLDVRAQLGEPGTALDGDEPSEVMSHSGSEYALQLRAKPLDAPGPALPVRAKLADGLAFVPLNKGDLYEIVFYNNSEHEVGVSFAIDGIDVFAFSKVRNPDGGPLTRYIAAPHGKIQLIGWLITDKAVSRFLVTQYGEGASSKFFPKATGNVGMITAQVSNSFDPDGAKSAGLETGFGPTERIDTPIIKRAFDPPHDTITVRYAR